MSQNYLKEVGSRLIENGYRIVPIGSGKKYPTGINNWQNLNLKTGDLKRFSEPGVGIITGVGDYPVVAFDVDASCPELVAQFSDWCFSNLGRAPVRVGRAPRQVLVYTATESGGRKTYSGTFEDFLGEAMKLEVLNAGQQFVAHHIHPDTGKPYQWVGDSLLDVPVELLPQITPEQIEKAVREFERIASSLLYGKVGESSYDKAERLSGRGEMVYDTESEPIERLRAALACVPVPSDHDPWVTLGMAIHEATGGSEDGRDLWHDHSRQGHNYDARTLDYKWRSFNTPTSKRGNAITRAYLFRQAIDHGWSDAVAPDTDGFEDVEIADVQAVNALALEDHREVSRKKHEAKSGWLKAVAEAADADYLQDELRFKIAADRSIDNIDREIIADALRKRLSTLGITLSAATCRKMIAPAKRDSVKREAATWVDGWVYITDEDKFYRIDSEEYLSAQGFNAKFNRMLPPPKEGELPKSAHRVALDEMGLPTVTRAAYVPWAQALFDMNGVQCVNRYRPSSAPEAADHIDADGWKAVSLVQRHLLMLTAGRQDLVDILISWMAYNVQNPGRKVRWAPLIKGIEGDGKTLIGQLMASVMGESNVKDISPKVLGTDFTGWAHGACIGLLEEIRMTGHNRHDILNALKPFITNDTVPIHAKGKDEYTTLNTMNYIAFTNHADALPLNDNDRRFFVIFTPFNSFSDLVEKVGDTLTYFNELFKALQTQRGALRRWLLDVKLDAKFDPNGRAPRTAEKNAMIGMSESFEQDAISTAIEQGGVGVGQKVLVTHKLRNLACQIDQSVDLKPSMIGHILMKMGWLRLPKQVKWRGEVCRVWHRGMGHTPCNDTIRELLDATLYDQKGNRVEDHPF
jgi:hypothetical protein